MEVASDDDLQNNHSDQEENSSMIAQSDNEEGQSYTEINNIQSPDFAEQQSNANSESEQENDDNSPKKDNSEVSDNEMGKENCEVESADEGSIERNSDDEQNAVQSEGEQEVTSDREVELATPSSPLPSDNEIERSDNEVEHSDDEAQNSENEVQHSDEEVQRSDEEAAQHSDEEAVQHSDEEAAQNSDEEVAQLSDEEAQHSDEEVQHSDEEVQHSDDEVQHSDVEIQQSDEDVQHFEDDAEVHHSNEEQEEHSDHSDEVHRSDEEVHHSDDEQSIPPSPAGSAEEKMGESDDEQKTNVAGGILPLSDNEESDIESDNESKVGELIADIFGESDEDEEFEGFGEADLAAAKEKKEKKRATVMSDSEEEEDEGGLTIVEEPKPATEDKNDTNNIQVLPAISDDEDSDVEPARRVPGDFVYDFEIMMQKKKEGQRRRKRKDVDIINDSDDLIAELIIQMKQISEEDRQLNRNKCAATKKLKLLPLVTSQLKKHDLKEAFLDQGILSVISDWLTPLPDRSLPHLQIRETMLKLLQEFPPIDQGLLKSSNIGRAVMYLYKHPKETKENRDRAGKLISEWARPIFNLNTNFHSMSKEEREQRDFEHMPKKRKMRLGTGGETTPAKDIDKALSGEDKALRPGEKGWIARARVPLPSMKDYVVRPKWNTELEFSRGSNRRVTTRLDKHIRSLKEKKKLSKYQRAVTISIEGRKMAL